MRLVGERADAKLVLSGVTLALGLVWTTPSLAGASAVNLRVDGAPPECIGAPELGERLAALPPRESTSPYRVLFR
jgi:hypothetical protein